ncbi:hypothetical protein [Methylobacterium fujisawaense]|jgi:hypothetical protein
MFALRPEEPDVGDLQTLLEAIDDLCRILEGDREAVIEGLAEILRRRIEFEGLRKQMDRQQKPPARSGASFQLGSRLVFEHRPELADSGQG